MVSFTFGESILGTQMSPGDGLNDMEDRTLAPAEIGIPDHPARILITLPTDPSWLPVTECINIISTHLLLRSVQCHARLSIHYSPLWATPYSFMRFLDHIK